MLDTLKIRKEGYPARPLHRAFWERYKPLFPDTLDHVELVEKLRVRGAGYSQKEIFIGKTKVLIADDTTRALEAERNVMMTKWAVVVQSVYRGCSAHTKYEMIRTAYHFAHTSLKEMLKRIKPFRQIDEAMLKDSQVEMKQFVHDNVAALESEADERRIAALEDDYSYRVYDALAGERFTTDKDAAFEAANASYTKGKAAITAIKSKLRMLEEEPSGLGADMAAGIARHQASSNSLKPSLSRPYKYTFKIAKQATPGESVFVVREC